MRKTIARRIPNRHKSLILLKEKNYTVNYISKEGKQIALNVQKHLLLGIPYKNREYQEELERRNF